ncbi:MAG: hypothetical protein ACK5YK_02575 [Pseudomonadota bacterium]
MAALAFASPVAADEVADLQAKITELAEANATLEAGFVEDQATIERLKKESVAAQTALAETSDKLVKAEAALALAETEAAAKIALVEAERDVALAEADEKAELLAYAEVELKASEAELAVALEYIHHPRQRPKHFGQRLTFGDITPSGEVGWYQALNKGCIPQTFEPLAPPSQVVEKKRKKKVAPPPAVCTVTVGSGADAVTYTITGCD